MTSAQVDGGLKPKIAPFVHLHNHSEYSLLDGIARCRDIAERCCELGFDAYALTDHGVMYGVLEFYQELRDKGLKPIVGCEVYVAKRLLHDKDPQLDRRSRHVVLLAKDLTGYINLMKLTSIAHTDGFYYKPRVDTETIMQHRQGLVALTACPGGVVAGPFNHEGPARAEEELDHYLRIFGTENLFLEIQNHGLEMEQRFIEWAREIAPRKGVRLVATNDCHYVRKEDARAHDIALCLRDKKQITDKDRLKYEGEEYYIKSAEQMCEIFADLPEAVANTRVVADMCNLELELDRVHFPAFTISRDDTTALQQWAAQNPAYMTPDDPEQNPGISQADVELAQRTGELAPQGDQHPVFQAYLRQLTYEGARQRYGEVTEELRQQIEYELSVIIPKGFTNYFLICAEFCRWAREQGIPVGPGRGSAAGSVVAYSLEITDLDPIKYGLYFERFLNPERIELPDFDIDFCMRRRDEVIEHVKEKYGPERVALIITYSRLKARAVIKAVGRTKGLEFQYVNRVTNEIRGLNPTIDEAIEASAELRSLIANDPEIAELIEDARRLEGIASHHGVHAAGLVIAPDDLSNFVPVQKHRDVDMLVTQYAMDSIPQTGLVKFDFLGLRNLTMIQDTAAYITEKSGSQFDPRGIPENDPETYAALQRGDGYGVFQFEAPQVKRMLIEGRPENVIDLAAINAANRPGPIQSGSTAGYLKARKAGMAGHARFKSISEILESTGGQLLFQEQVMEIARKLGGFSLGEADVLRKAMGKKKHDIMEDQKKRFLVGARERGVGEWEATEIWDMLAKFAGYGFNKAHSVCYSWISYQTAFLKTHYPSFYMSAMLNNYLSSSERLAEILAQCRKMRIDVVPPSVNDGGFGFVPASGETIIFGLGGIKGIGENAVNAILDQRRLGGPFKSLAGFLQRTRGAGVNRKVLQCLAMAGAFDCIEPNRAELLLNLDEIEAYMRGGGKQEALFGLDESSGSDMSGEGMVSDYQLALYEKQAVGVFLTHHPFADHEMFSDRRFLQLAVLQEAVMFDHGKWQDRPLPAKGLAGIMTSLNIRTANTSGKSYAKCRLEDPERSVNVLIWPRTFEEAREHILENNPVVICGRLQIPETVESPESAWDELEIVAESVRPYRPANLPQAQLAKPGNGLGNGHGGNAVNEPGINGLDLPEQNMLHDSAASYFNPLPINWEIDLGRTDMRQLSKLARQLEDCKGECEVRMRLREVSGQLKRIKVNRRFFTTIDIASQLEQEFPFITPLG